MCFRQGNVEGFGTNISYCPLGGMEFTPNQAPGETVELEARPEADSLPAEYQVRRALPQLAYRNGRNFSVALISEFLQNF